MERGGGRWMEGREIWYGDTLPCVGLGGGMQVSGVGCSELVHVEIW